MRYDLLPFKELVYPKSDKISQEIYSFIKNKTDYLTSNKIGWQFLDTITLMLESPELSKFFKEYRLVPKTSAITILIESDDLPVHIDEPPVIAKINFPVVNTEGWSNRWFKIDDSVLKKCPIIENQFGKKIPDLAVLLESSMELIDKIDNMKYPVVFNSMIPHSVVKIDPAAKKRIVASFTFYNDPKELLIK